MIAEINKAPLHRNLAARTDGARLPLLLGRDAAGAKKFCENAAIVCDARKPGFPRVLAFGRALPRRAALLCIIIDGKLACRAAENSRWKNLHATNINP